MSPTSQMKWIKVHLHQIHWYAPPVAVPIFHQSLASKKQGFGIPRYFPQTLRTYRKISGKPMEVHGPHFRIIRTTTVVPFTRQVALHLRRMAEIRGNFSSYDQWKALQIQNLDVQLVVMQKRLTSVFNTVEIHFLHALENERRPEAWRWIFPV